MASPTVPNVPNVPIDPMFEVKGTDVVLTSVGKNFFEQFIKYFFTNFSSEGLVAPTQTNASPSYNINTIQDNKNPQGEYTCAYGTLLYDITTNNLVVCLNNGSNQPLFQNILTAESSAFLLL